jgi:post-segregation antitoxin (ccd killing protein)
MVFIGVIIPLVIMMNRTKSGRPGKVPKPDLITTIDRDLLERARLIARSRGISVSAIVERALDRYLLILEQDGIPQSTTPAR